MKKKPVQLKKRCCSRRTKWVLIIFIILVIILGLFIYSRSEIYKSYNIASKTTFEIKKGESVDEIAQNLQNKGLIKTPVFFKIYLVLSNNSSKLQTGIYSFEGKLSIPSLVEKLVEGITAENQITILEGMRLEEIAGLLEKKSLVKTEDFIKEAENISKYQSEFIFLTGLKKTDTLEGFLFPDTYRFEAKTTAEEIIRKMLKNFDTKLTPEMRAQIKKQNKSIKEIVILASIIEREVIKKSEKAVVSGIYQNRLKLEMRLEADPTVQYAKETQNPPRKFENYWQEITAADYRAVISPYNTYLHLGLLPAPICSPGIDSISAAIKPKKNDYLYFFTPDGSIYYSRTLEEHEAKKNKYLK